MARIEAYPVDPQRKLSSAEPYTWTLAASLDLGFKVVARHSTHRPIVGLGLERNDG